MRVQEIDVEMKIYFETQIGGGGAVSGTGRFAKA
jgi:hypothetical protein